MRDDFPNDFGDELATAALDALGARDARRARLGVLGQRRDEGAEVLSRHDEKERVLCGGLTERLGDLDGRLDGNSGQADRVHAVLLDVGEDRKLVVIELHGTAGADRGIGKRSAEGAGPGNSDAMVPAHPRAPPFAWPATLSSGPRGG